MENKRYYWIKLKQSFYESNEAIDFLLTQPDGHGAEYVVLYQMLCLKTANNDGVLCSKMGEIIVPYDIDKITRDCKYFDRDVVANALEYYKQLGLVYEEKDSGYLVISDIENMIGRETASAERKRRQRNKSVTMSQQCHKNVTQCNVTSVGHSRDNDIPQENAENENDTKNAEKTPEKAQKSSENVEKAGQCHKNVTQNVTADIEIDIEKEIDIYKQQAARACTREEPPPENASNAKEEFFKAFPYVHLNGADDRSIDYEKLLTAFREGNDYLQNTKSMNYVTAHYSEIIGGKYRRADKPAAVQQVRKNGMYLWRELANGITQAKKEKVYSDFVGDYVAIYCLSNEKAKQRVNEIFESFSQEIKNYLDIESFLEFCEMSDEDLKFERARFLRAVA